MEPERLTVLARLSDADAGLRLAVCEWWPEADALLLFDHAAITQQPSATSPKPSEDDGVGHVTTSPLPSALP